MNQKTRHFQDSDFANAMMSMVRSGGDGNSPSDIAWQVCEHVQSGLRLEDVVLYLINEDETELVQTAAAGPKNPSGRDILKPIQIPVGSGIVGTVAKTGVPEIIGDTSRDPRYILDDGYRFSEISVPVIHSGRLIGVLDSECISRGYYTSGHLEKLELMASLASTHLARVTAEVQLQNLTKQRNQLEEIATQHVEFSEQVGSMEKWLSRMDRDVSHIVHHELRTPLNAIMGISDLLDDFFNRSEGGQKELIPLAGLLRRNAQDLSGRITDLLDLPRLLGSSTAIATYDADVTALLQDIRARVEHKVVERGLVLDVDIPLNTTTLRCEPGALGRVIYSLIDNAVKFSSHGTILVRLIVDKKGVPTDIVVIDQGIGIDEAHIDKIFQPFFQIDSATTRRYGGLGLGLPLARRLCNDMGYELAVDSQPDHGSTFRVKFDTDNLIILHEKRQLSPCPDRVTIN